ncbi:hypothetical protein GGF31_008967 [Allomyces arbusculus]|nr:hypothetical protein GGF31_008967 [Allomyces arbusculus]
MPRILSRPALIKRSAVLAPGTQQPPVDADGAVSAADPTSARIPPTTTTTTLSMPTTSASPSAATSTSTPTLQPMSASASTGLIPRPWLIGTSSLLLAVLILLVLYVRARIQLSRLREPPAAKRERHLLKADRRMILDDVDADDDGDLPRYTPAVPVVLPTVPPASVASAWWRPGGVGDVVVHVPMGAAVAAAMGIAVPQPAAVVSDLRGSADVRIAVDDHPHDGAERRPDEPRRARCRMQ